MNEIDWLNRWSWLWRIFKNWLSQSSNDQTACDALATLSQNSTEIEPDDVANAVEIALMPTLMNGRNETITQKIAILVKVSMLLQKQNMKIQDNNTDKFFSHERLCAFIRPDAQSRDNLYIVSTIVNWIINSQALLDIHSPFIWRAILYRNGRKESLTNTTPNDIDTAITDVTQTNPTNEEAFRGCVNKYLAIVNPALWHEYEKLQNNTTE